MDRIKRVLVELDDGSTQEWSGRGTASVSRTGNTSSNQLKDHNTHFVMVTLQFDKKED